MTIAAWLGCKDEVELLPRTLAHLRRIGVERIFAVDVMSTDGSRELLEAEARQSGDLEMLSIDVNVDDTEVEHRIAAEVMDRAQALGMGWLLFCDADEFVLPRTGRLIDLVPETQVDAISIPRYNVALAEDGPCLTFPVTPGSYERALVHCPPHPGKGGWRKLLAEAPDMPWIQVVPSPKVMIRLGGAGAVQAGHHGVRSPKGRPKPVTLTTPDAVIAHVPFSSLGRFRRKVRNIVALHEATGAPWPENQAWHWRMFRDGAAESGVEAEFARNVTPEPRRADLRAGGLLRTVSDLLDDQTR
ncbi:MAG: glycosyltransferase family 2 protein [Pseudomonadota bacterium]